MAGRKPGTELRVYDSVRAAPAIYVMELGTQTVKVGMAERSALSRIRELHTAAKHVGFTPGRFEVFYFDAQHLSGLETDCVRALRAVAQPCPGRREYFTGITFDDALAVTRKAIPSPSL